MRGMGVKMEMMNGIAAVALAGTLALSFSGAADAQAQIARSLRFSPPLMTILMKEPTYQDMLKQFRDLAKSPERANLAPDDFQSMALLAFQGVAENAVTTPEALETILLMHESCGDARHRREISNAAKDILRFRPQQHPAVRKTLGTMMEAEQDDGVRAYIAGVVAAIDAKFQPAPQPE